MTLNHGFKTNRTFSWFGCKLLLFSDSVLSNSFQPHGLQHTNLPCPSPSPWVWANSCPLSWWYHPTISSSVTPLSSCPQSFLASESFPMNRLFTSGGQSIGASASASVLPVNIQNWFHLGLTGLIDLLVAQGTLKSLLQHHSSKHQFFGTQLSGCASKESAYNCLTNFG